MSTAWLRRAASGCSDPDASQDAFDSGWLAEGRLTRCFFVLEGDARGPGRRRSGGGLLPTPDRRLRLPHQVEGLVDGLRFLDALRGRHLAVEGLIEDVLRLLFRTGGRQSEVVEGAAAERKQGRTV